MELPGAARPVPSCQARAAAAYKQVQVGSRSPLELVVMLYDGALAALCQARDALGRRDLVGKAGGLSKGFAIVAELQGSLNLDEGGDVAARLDDLYTYVMGRLSEANIGGDPAPLDESIRLLTTLREAWSEIALRAVAADQ
jgi:flagellar protein FliS